MAAEPSGEAACMTAMGAAWSIGWQTTRPVRTVSSPTAVGVWSPRLSRLLFLPRRAWVGPCPCRALRFPAGLKLAPPEGWTTRPRPAGRKPMATTATTPVVAAV